MTKKKCTPATMSEAEYSRHRNLTRQRISGLKKRGVLVMHGHRVDVAKSDAVLDAQPSEGRETILEAQRRKEAALADLREMDLARRRGEFIETSKVKQDTFSVFRTLRDAILATPDRAIPGGDPESRRLRAHVATELRSVLDGFATRL